MITSQQLRDRLNAMPNIREVARRAGLPEKTVYRTANGKTTPTLETAQRIWNAITTLEDDARNKVVA
jgi:DNA-binding phage protein